MVLQLQRTIAIPPDAPTGFDHGDVMLDTGQVFVAHTGAGSVEVLDGEGGAHVATIPGCPEASGVLCVQEDALAFAAARGARKILVIDPSSHQTLREIQAGSRPNGLAWDPTRRQLLVADVEDNRARIVQPQHGSVVAEVPLPGRPRWCVFDTSRDRYLVNIREPACVAALPGDLAADPRRVPISVDGPHGLDLDRKRDRAFVACDGGAVVVLDLTRDESIGTVPIAGVPDAIWYNPVRERLYVAVGDPGVVDVVNTDSLAVDEEVVTEKGAHTTAYDDRRQLLYVFLPQSSRATVYAEE
jgi:DNA-binding beta-propeller fold protein YncE